MNPWLEVGHFSKEYAATSNKLRRFEDIGNVRRFYLKLFVSHAGACQAMG